MATSDFHFDSREIRPNLSWQSRSNLKWFSSIVMVLICRFRDNNAFKYGIWLMPIANWSAKPEASPGAS